jgi:hypothetical protein
MPTLPELQHAMRAALIGGDDGAAVEMLADGVPADRLDIYRNTFVAGATRALRLSFPAVHLLVGDDFFAGAAAMFISQHPPRAACLDGYGAEFPQFLHGFPPAASLEYLVDVARLEWAVGRALHAPDIAPLDLARLQALQPEEQIRIRFVPHPSIALLCLDYPVDLIWRGVLSADDAALAAVDLTSGPAHLLVERRATGVEIMRLDMAAWRFASALCEGWPLGDVFAALPPPDAEDQRREHEAKLASHLAAGRFVDFHLAPHGVTRLTPSSES